MAKNERPQTGWALRTITNRTPKTGEPPSDGEAPTCDTYSGEGTQAYPVCEPGDALWEECGGTGRAPCPDC